MLRLRVRVSVTVLVYGRLHCDTEFDCRLRLSLRQLLLEFAVEYPNL